MPNALADFRFEVEITSYSNPSNREADGDCCDDFFGSCNDNCEPYYDFVCLRQSGHNTADLSTCPLGGVSGEYDTGDTVTISESGAWPVSIRDIIYS